MIKMETISGSVFDLDFYEIILASRKWISHLSSFDKFCIPGPDANDDSCLDNNFGN